ncbi:alpha-amylase [Roridomyces roridus]|uniref:Alpha-amylase n=1 Tax=Roridomyces roridus TaxID=1738132 RepID=A0AAD7B6Q3_9AGAR|nr:alpha-amylase [Roridomyces roridus]
MLAIIRAQFSFDRLQKRTIPSSRYLPHSSTECALIPLQLFEWPWNSVASECASFLGPAGYGYVQVSPASEHIQGSQWWTDYQTVSYTLISKRGSRAQFANMVTACKNAGVGIIVDVVFNHMTSGSGTGFAGNSYSKYNYPAVPYTPANFHYCAGNGVAAQITNYDDANNVRFCELVGLADLAQEQTAVRNIMAAYLNDLSSLGVAGYRLDASKHMLSVDIGAILGMVKYSYYDTQEVIFGAGEPITPAQYVNNGDVIEFRAPSSLLTYFTASPGLLLKYLPAMGAAWGFVPSNVANFIMANQDTERGGTSLTSASPNNAYTLGAVFMLAFNYGTPTVYSGYNYTGYDQGAPQNAQGYTNAVTCGSNGWRCEHRWPAIANMIAFHNAVGGTALTNIFKGTSQQTAFGRGATGFLIINNQGSTWTNAKWNTSLPAGKYCDIIHDTSAGPTACNGPTYVVSASGTFSASVGAYDALAIFTGFAPSPTGATVTFAETASTVAGQAIYLVGSIGALGSWAPAAAVAMTKSASGSVWSATVVLPANTAIQYKFIKKSGTVVTWESDPNRAYTTSAKGSKVTLTSTWR